MNNIFMRAPFFIPDDIKDLDNFYRPYFFKIAAFTTNQKIMDIMVRQDLHLRAELARNKNLPFYIQKKLANDDRSYVKYVLHKNNSIHPEIKKILSADYELQKFKML